MLEYFLTNGNRPLLEANIQHPNLIHPHWKYLTDRVLYNLDMVLDYYLDTELFVSNQHIINRYLKLLLIATDINKEDKEIVRDVAIASENISRQCGITTLNRMGEVSRNVFYSGFSYEVLYAVNRVPNLDTLPDKWIYKTPIKITTNDDLLLTFYTYNAKMVKYEPSLSTYCINPITLVLCYKYWKNYRENKGTYASTTQHYIPTFVLPRMNWNMLGLLVFNKLVNIVDGKISNLDPLSAFKHPFYLKDYNVRVNDILVEMLPRYMDYPTGLIERLLHMLLPLRNDKTIRHMLLIDNLNTRQSRWIPLAARLPTCLSVIKILGQKGKYGSNSAYNSLRILLRELDNNKQLLKEPLPRPIQHQLADTIDEIKSLIL
jgi:hypothetical protein